MNSVHSKFLFGAVIIIVSTVIPIGVLSLFFVIFSDFYNKGFLTGLTHLIICLPMILIDFLISAIWLGKYFRNKEEHGISKLIFRLLVSVIAQVILNILLENPFVDPPASGF